ncbi:MAG: histidine phosphatase family protein [Prevotella sp.]|nr:histidine phosphatase family protein [Prevotella sp.]
MTTLYLVRHGETVDNARHIMQGQTQGELSEAGVLQARQLAEQLRSEHFDAFVASDLKRAIDTCTLLAAPHAQPVDTTPLLRERDWGSFTGRYIPDLKDETWPDDIESLNELQARARRFLKYIKKTYPNQRVLAVGHGIINKAIQAVHYGKRMQQVEKMSNCEVRVIEL